MAKQATTKATAPRGKSVRERNVRAGAVAAVALKPPFEPSLMNVATRRVATFTVGTYPGPVRKDGTRISLLCLTVVDPVAGTTKYVGIMPFDLRQVIDALSSQIPAPDA
jgi:hypothetical protein